jgi:ADP-ribose pyrophosphatase
VFDGKVRNSLAVIGLLAVARLRSTSQRLRPVDAD